MTIVDSRAGSSWILGWGLNGSNSSDISFYNGSSFVQATGSSMPSGWSHVAVVRHNNTINVYVNGTSLASGANSTNFNGTGTLTIGKRYEGGVSFEGKIAGFRIVKGTAVYTNNFAVPTSLPTAVTGTELLLNFGATAAPTVSALEWYSYCGSGYGYNSSTSSTDCNIVGDHANLYALVPTLTIGTQLYADASANSSPTPDLSTVHAVHTEGNVIFGGFIYHWGTNGVIDSIQSCSGY
jgi:hypothetical protein